VAAVREAAATYGIDLDEASVDDESPLCTIVHTGPFDLTGHPALSVPCGEVDGRPVGFQAIMRYDDETTAMRVGSAVEGR